MTEIFDVLDTDIAVVGMACRFPGAADIDAFWERVCEGSELLTRFSDDELRDAGVSQKVRSNPNYVPVTSLIDNAGGFDAQFFGVTPKEAEFMDPQHRLFLELAWLALQDAGCDASSFAGDVGVFAGAARNTYLRNNVGPLLDQADNLDGSVQGLQADIGNYGDFLATRVSYKLGLRGPGINVQTACSTSLVAVHLACQSLLTGECDVALAGGVAVLAPQVNGYLYEEGSISSQDGHCRPFDSRANGTVFGNGAGVVCLKRLSDAINDRDQIVAVVKGTAINNDGSDKMSYSAPSIAGQARVIRQAHSVGEIDPSTISYVEAHGTGTALGDPIEIAALTAAFGGNAHAEPFCAVGAVKAQIGHLGAAAGVAGFIKAALSVQRGQIPPLVNFCERNSAIPSDGSPFYFPTSLQSWSSGIRRAAVSSFGIGGTNAHAVLQSPPPVARSDKETPTAVPLLLSARTETDLAVVRQQMADRLARGDIDLVDAAYTLANGREAGRFRDAVVIVHGDDVVGRLRADSSFSRVKRAELDVVFAFPGQGSAFAGMGADLYERDSVFREEMDEVARTVTAASGIDVLSALRRNDVSSLLSETAFVQPVLFAFEYALARTLQRSGLTPSALLGHSVGQYVAACLAGVFSVDDAISLLVTRGALMNETTPGSMLAVRTTEMTLRAMLPSSLTIAAVNAPDQCVVSGADDEVAGFLVALDKSGIEHTYLDTRRSFHSASMDPVLDAFEAAVSSVTLQPPSIPVACNVTGGWLTAAQATSPRYWADHIRQAVRFADDLRTVSERPIVLVEVGPGRALSSMTRQTLPDVHAIATVRQSATLSPVDVCADVWTHGGVVDWNAHFQRTACRRVSLPTHPLNRQHYWITPPVAEAKSVDNSFISPAPNVRPLIQALSWRQASLTSLPSDVAEGSTVRITRRLDGNPDEPFVLDVDKGNEMWSVRFGAVDRTEIQTLISRVNSETSTTSYVFDFTNGPSADDDLVTAAASFSRDAWLLATLLDAVCDASGQTLTRVAVLIADRQTGMNSPAMALLDGPCLVLPQERSNLALVVIATDRELLSDAALASELRTLKVASPVASVVAYRVGGRYVRTFETLPVEPLTFEWSTGGSYLITGGTGGIGLTIAKDAARTPGVKLCLVSRSPFPDREDWAGLLVDPSLDPSMHRRLEAVIEMEALGATVSFMQADTTDGVAIQEVVAKCGPFEGVVHAAGAPGGRLASGLDEWGAVLAPKVHGAIELSYAVDKPAWVAYCSSLSSVLGGVGQSEYAAANAFLDAFAEYETSQGRPSIAVGFDAWSEVGMAALPPSPTEHVAGPILTRKSTEGQRSSYSGMLTADDHWVLDEHRIAGVPVLPGTAMVEILRSVAADVVGADHLCLQDLYFLRPLAVVNESIDIKVDVNIASMEMVLSGRRGLGDDWTEYAICLIGASAVEMPVVGAPVWPEVRSGRVPLSDVVTFGPRWSNVVGVESAQSDGGDAVAFTELSSVHHDDLVDYVLHPALLDTMAGAIASDLDGSYLPLSYGEVHVHGAMTDRVIGRVRRRVDDGDDSTLVLDIDVCNADGSPVCAIRRQTFRRVESTFTPGDDWTISGDADNERLCVGRPGDLSSISFAPVKAPEVAADEVQLEVLATGMNFKEVLIALDMLGVDPGNHPFGLECAGVVRAVGRDVRHLSAGDAVMAIAPGCFVRIVNVPARLTALIPEGMSFAEAATIPVAYMTAYDALVNVAGMTPGERVLVHSATGGVGMAAMEIARLRGAEVYATAGSDEKRALAVSRGAVQAFDSRDDRFASELQSIGGVDIVLNSLAGDLIVSGISTLRHGGRFVELGRRDIQAGMPLSMALFEKGISFSVYNPNLESAEFAERWRTLADLVEPGRISALPLRSFASTDVAAAFAYMSTGKHVGKVVVVRPGADRRPRQAAEGKRDDAQLSPAEGLAGFHRAISSGRSHVLVAASDVAARQGTLMLATSVTADDMSSQDGQVIDLGDLSGSLEQTVGTIWAELLGLHSISRDDCFLDLGGDSLLATQVVARLRDRVDVRVSPADVLRDNSLKEFVELLDSDTSITRLSADHHVERGEL